MQGGGGGGDPRGGIDGLLPINMECVSAERSLGGSCTIPPPGGARSVREVFLKPPRGYFSWGVHLKPNDP